MTVIRGAFIVGVTFKHLQGISFIGCTFFSCFLYDGSLSEVCFTDCRFVRCSLCSATIGGVYVHNCTMVGGVLWFTEIHRMLRSKLECCDVDLCDCYVW